MLGSGLSNGALELLSLAEDRPVSVLNDLGASSGLMFIAWKSIERGDVVNLPESS